MQIRHYHFTDLAARTRLVNRCLPDYPRTAEVLEHWDRRRPAVNYRHHLVGEIDGRIVAEADLDSCSWCADPGVFILDILVDPDHRSKGYAGQLWEAASEQLARLRWTRLLGGALADNSVAVDWLERLGFTLDDTELTSRLELEDYQRPADYERVLERFRSQGFITKTYGGINDPEKERRLWELTEESCEDMPGSLEYQRRSFKEWRRMTQSPARDIDTTLVALDGDEFIGLTELSFKGGRQAPAEIDCTGTRREYRGRGVATALKYLSVDWAKANGVTAIYTVNTQGNDGILSINRKLGFEPRPPWLFYGLGNEDFAGLGI